MEEIFKDDKEGKCNMSIRDMVKTSDRVQLKRFLESELSMPIRIDVHRNTFLDVGNVTLEVGWTPPHGVHTTMYLSEMPGQCGILVAHKLPTIQYITGNGVLRTDIQSIAIVEATAMYLLYGAVMISHIRGASILKTWQEHGYKEIYSVHNPHSLNKVVVYAKEI